MKAENEKPDSSKMFINPKNIDNTPQYVICMAEYGIWGMGNKVWCMT